MSKTTADLKLGDTVWVNGTKQYFAGFDATRTRIYLADILFNVWGSASINDEGISLTEPLPKLKKGQPVWVKNHSNTLWTPRLFVRFANKYCVTSDPQSCWHIKGSREETWHEWMLPTRKELIDTGIDPEAWESSG